MYMGMFLNYSRLENAAALVSSKLGITLSSAREGVSYEGNQCVYQASATSVKYVVDMAAKTVTPVQEH